jgi:hypothetical protein
MTEVEILIVMYSLGVDILTVGYLTVDILT